MSAPLADGSSPALAPKSATTAIDSRALSSAHSQVLLAGGDFSKPGIFGVQPRTVWVSSSLDTISWAKTRDPKKAVSRPASAITSVTSSSSVAFDDGPAVSPFGGSSSSTSGGKPGDDTVITVQFADSAGGSSTSLEFDCEDPIVAATWLKALTWLKGLNSQVSQPFNFQHHVTVSADFTWELPPNTSIESIFELGTVLGQGTFGKVFKARHRDTGFALAVKLVNVEGISDVSEIKREVDVLKECRFKNIVDYFGCWGPDSQHQLWTFMSYCQFGSAIDLLYSAQVYLTETQIAFIIASTLAGLHYLHTVKKIVHRDVKARNILITDTGCVKLADFGISKQESLENAAFSTIGTGSPHWMSPEVVQDQPATFASDIWSLGITAIELTSCLPPRATLSVDEVMEATVRDPPPTLDPAPRGSPAWSRDFTDFVAQCLQKDPALRPTTADLLKHSFVRSGIMETRSLDPIMRRVEAQQRLQAGGRLLDTPPPRPGDGTVAGAGAGAGAAVPTPVRNLNAATLPGNRVRYQDNRSAGALASPNGPGNGPIAESPEESSPSPPPIPPRRQPGAAAAAAAAAAGGAGGAGGAAVGAGGAGAGHYAHSSLSPTSMSPHALNLNAGASGASLSGGSSGGYDISLDDGPSGLHGGGSSSGAGSGKGRSTSIAASRTVSRAAFEDTSVAFSSKLMFNVPASVDRAIKAAPGTHHHGGHLAHGHLVSSGAANVAEKFNELCLPPFLEIVVGAPETRSSTLGNYSAYPIRVRANPAEGARACTLPADAEEVGTPLLAKLVANRETIVVYRRYSDFVWLHDQLEFAFPSLLIPPIPGKHLTGNFDDDVLADRRQGLQWCLDAVARHPVLSRSFLFHAFVRLSADKVSGLKKYVTQKIDDLRKAAKALHRDTPAAASAGQNDSSAVVGGGVIPINPLTGFPPFSFPLGAALTADLTYADAVNPVKESVGFFSKLKSKVVSSKTTSLLLSLPAQSQLTAASLYAKDITWYLGRLEQHYARSDKGLTAALEACAVLGLAVSRWVTSADQGRQTLAYATEPARAAAPATAAAAAATASRSAGAGVGADGFGTNDGSKVKLPKSAKKAAVLASQVVARSLGQLSTNTAQPLLELETVVGPAITLLAQRLSRDLGPILTDRATRLNFYGMYPAKFYRKLCDGVRSMIRRRDSFILACRKELKDDPSTSAPVPIDTDTTDSSLPSSSSGGSSSSSSSMGPSGAPSLSGGRAFGSAADEARALALPRTQTRGRLDAFTQSVLGEVALFQAQKHCHLLTVTGALAATQREAAEKEAGVWEAIERDLDAIEDDADWADVEFDVSLGRPEYY